MYRKNKNAKRIFFAESSSHDCEGVSRRKLACLFDMWRNSCRDKARAPPLAPRPSCPRCLGLAEGFGFVREVRRLPPHHPIAVLAAGSRQLGPEGGSTERTHAELGKHAVTPEKTLLCASVNRTQPLVRVGRSQPRLGLHRDTEEVGAPPLPQGASDI